MFDSKIKGAQGNLGSFAGEFQQKKLIRICCSKKGLFQIEPFLLSVLFVTASHKTANIKGLYHEKW